MIFLRRGLVARLHTSSTIHSLAIEREREKKDSKNLFLRAPDSSNLVRNASKKRMRFDLKRGMRRAYTEYFHMVTEFTIGFPSGASRPFSQKSHTQILK